MHCSRDPWVPFLQRSDSLELGCMRFITLVIFRRTHD